MADVDWGASVEEQEQNLASQVESLRLDKNVNASSSGQDSAASATPTPKESESPGGAAQGAEGNARSKEEDLLKKLIHSKLVSTKSNLEILQKDPDSPLYSVKTFEALHLKKELLVGIYKMGYTAPSKIQETALPALLADPPANMIAQSQSGTGKTAAFVLTMLSRTDTNLNYPQCLCLAPTYELALQIGKNVEQMGQKMDSLRVCYAVRGERVSRGEQKQDHIIIGTPGTACDWVIKYRCFDPKLLKVFVLDEADIMIATQGHQDQSIRLQRKLSPDCQMLLFSATYDDDVMKFAQAVIPRSPIIIKLRREEESLDNIRQFYIECENEGDKFRALSNIYGSISIGQSIIFCATRKTAAWLAGEMTQDGHAVGLLTGELQIDQRAAIITRFKSGMEKVMITTNVTARGIDVEQVTVVVNFDPPLTHDYKPDYETYLHRIGRTGRFGKKGLAINMIDGRRSLSIIKDIEKHFGRKIVKLDADDIEEIERSTK